MRGRDALIFAGYIYACFLSPRLIFWLLSFGVECALAHFARFPVFVLFMTAVGVGRELRGGEMEASGQGLLGGSESAVHMPIGGGRRKGKAQWYSQQAGAV